MFNLLDSLTQLKPFCMSRVEDDHVYKTVSEKFAITSITKSGEQIKRKVFAKTDSAVSGKLLFLL